VAESKPPQFVLVAVPSAGIEQFVIMDTGAALPAFRLWSQEASAVEDWMAAVQRHFAALPRLSHAEVRLQLSGRGLSAAEIDAQLQRARKMTTLLAAAPALGPPFQHITRIGYRNREGQEVVRKTDRSGPDNQRVFVMRCHVCGHEYGAYGCDADIRRCPSCQDGPPGLPTRGA
jgi:hypothetical protein